MWFPQRALHNWLKPYASANLLRFESLFISHYNFHYGLFESVPPPETDIEMELLVDLKIGVMLNRI